jgi:hypothetical protein
MAEEDFTEEKKSEKYSNGKRYPMKERDAPINAIQSGTCRIMSVATQEGGLELSARDAFH